MSIPEPAYFRWNGEASVMEPLHAKRADRVYTDGEVYRLGIVEERSTNSHNHYFAALHEAWMNLPERIAADYPTEDHLRKHALIRCGYFEARSIVCSSKAEALRVMAFIKPMDDYAIVTLSGGFTVRQFTAKSQSMKAMGKEEFQESKESVLAWVSNLIGVASAELGKAHA